MNISIFSGHKPALAIAVGALLISTPVFSASPPAVPSSLTLCVGDEPCRPANSGGGGGGSNGGGGGGKTMKWNPGMYIISDKRSYPEIYGNPQLLGVKRAYNWGDLETSKGVYDFSVIEQDLKELKAHGKRLMFELRYKTFNRHARSGACAPQYLRDSGGVVLNLNPERGQDPRCHAMVWKPWVTDRLNALIVALGKRFDGEANFEALILPETSSGLGTELESRHNYSVSAYVKQTERTWAAAREAFPRSVIIQHANFLIGGDSVMRNFMESAYRHGIGIGGPDLMPNRHTLASQFFADYAGKMPLQIENQRGDRVGGSSVDRAYRYAVTEPKGLHANYLVWHTVYDSPWHWTGDILPVVKKYQGKTNAGCPDNMSCTAR